MAGTRLTSTFQLSVQAAPLALSTSAGELLEGPFHTAGAPAEPLLSSMSLEKMTHSCSL